MFEFFPIYDFVDLRKKIKNTKQSVLNIYSVITEYLFCASLYPDNIIQK